MLLEEIKKRMFAAMKAGKTIEKEVLRVAVGEITTAEARATEALGDDGARAIVKKLIKSNEETLKLTDDAGHRAALEEELAVLRALLPASLGVGDIVERLAPVAEMIRAAKNDGQATGIAAKHLKASGIDADGKNIALAAVRLRS